MDTKVRDDSVTNPEKMYRRAALVPHKRGAAGTNGRGHGAR